MKTFLKLWNDESGASAAEYALILAIVGGAIAVAAIALGNAVSGAIQNAATCINDTQTCADSAGGGGTGTGTGTGTGSGA
jgi:pilus assembly protein Flp/PilA